MFVYDSTHYHLTIVETRGNGVGMLVYDFTHHDPITVIDQFATLVSMVDAYDFGQVHTEVTDHFIECIQEGAAPYIVVGGDYMAEGIYECQSDCRVSPSMN